MPNLKNQRKPLKDKEHCKHQKICLYRDRNCKPIVNRSLSIPTIGTLLNNVAVLSKTSNRWWEVSYTLLTCCLATRDRPKCSRSSNKSKWSSPKIDYLRTNSKKINRPYLYLSEQFVLMAKWTSIGFKLRRS